jgi:hypothetical protein
VQPEENTVVLGSSGTPLKRIWSGEGFVDARKGTGLTRQSILPETLKQGQEKIEACR